MKGGYGRDLSLIITFLLLAITENIQDAEDSRDTFPLRNQRRERIKHTSRQLHELESAFEINQYPSVSGREHLARKIGVTESHIQVHNCVLIQHIFRLCKYARCVIIEPRSFNLLYLFVGP